MIDSLPERKKQAARVVRRLRADYPDAECALRFDTPLQLLVATILSAQCTDARVNLVTAVLFAKYPTAEDLAGLSLAKLETLVKSTGFFRSKAKAIKACCTDLVQKYDGQPPRDMESMVALAGVGRKTASVVLGTAYGIPSGVVVDTHVGRLSRRLGLTRHTDAVQAERDLMQVLPKGQWIDFSHHMIHHGRAVCGARKAKCDVCSMAKFCPRIGLDER